MSDISGNPADETEDFNSDLSSHIPAADIADAVASAHKIQNPDDVVGMCADCGSPQNSSKLERNSFVQEGKSASCSYCGGPVVLVFAEIQKQAYDQITAQRGAY